jgi:AraC-like DNA-binding protein
MNFDWPNIKVRILPEPSGRHKYARGCSIDPIMEPCVSDYDLWYIWTGNCKVKTRSGIKNLHSGDCMWIGPGWSYDYEQDPDNPIGLSYIHFELYENGIRIDPNDRKNRPPDLLHVKDSQLVESIVRRTLEFCRIVQTGRMQAPLEEQSIELLFHGLLLNLTNEIPGKGQPRARKLPMEQHRLITQLTTYIHDNIRTDISVTQLAERSGYSRDYVARIFKIVTGMSPQQYIIAAKLANAQLFLKRSLMSISEIADKLGYRDIHFFSRQFKQHIGMSPKAFRIFTMRTNR